MAEVVKDYDKMLNFLVEGNKKIDNTDIHDGYNKVVSSIKLASQHADTVEKCAWLSYVLVDQCNRMGYWLYRHGLLTAEAETDLKSFDFPENALAIAREAGNADADSDRKLTLEHMEIEKRRQEIDIFKAMLAGDTLEEATRKEEEYLKKYNETVAQLNASMTQK